MKRFRILIAAIIICLSVTSCSKNNNNSENDNQPVIEDVSTDTKTVSDVSDSTEKTTASSDTKKASDPGKKTDRSETAVNYEKGTVFTENDFTDIQVKLLVSDNEPTHKMHTLDTSTLDFGKRMSPCKAPDVRDQYIPSIDSILESVTEEISASEIKYFEKLYNEALEQIKSNIDKPSEGTVIAYTINGDSVFMYVNFDDLCSEHDYSIFEYRTDTGKLTEIKRVSGLDTEPLLNIGGGLHYYDGKLICEYIDIKNESIKIHALDISTGQVSQLLENENRRVWYSDENTLIFSENVFALNTLYITEAYSSTTNNTLYRYNNGELEEIGKFKAYDSCQSLMYNGEFIKFTNDESNSDQPLIIETPDYTLNTDLTGTTFIAATPDCVILAGASFSMYTSSPLYIYDLATRERCEIEIPGCRILSVAGRDVIYSDDKGTYILDTKVFNAFRLFNDNMTITSQASDYTTLERFNDTSDDMYLSQIYWFNKE